MSHLKAHRNASLFSVFAARTKLLIDLNCDVKADQASSAELRRR